MVLISWYQYNYKHMKITIIAIMLCLAGQLFAQHDKQIKGSEVEGFYLSLADFQSGKLTRPIDNQHESDKIKLNQFFASPQIISIEQDKESVFYKDSIFAIRIANGENYRFINRNPCFVADTSYLYIYTYKTTKKSGTRRRTKEYQLTYHYFSTANHRDVYLLTLANLRKHAFTDAMVQKAVAEKFTTDAMLAKVNPKSGRFELNETILSVVKK
jgi:hypothetical protein